jgi:uncharacterized protein (DUF1501 family)
MPRVGGRDAAAPVNCGRILADRRACRRRLSTRTRDLKPTADIGAMLKRLLPDHVGVPEQALANVVLPQTAELKPIDKLAPAP